MAIRTIYHFTALTGGDTNALDSIDGNYLNEDDRAFVIIAGAFSVYWLDEDSGQSESSPNIIAPDSNPGDKRWIKCT